MGGLGWAAGVREDCRREASVGSGAGDGGRLRVCDAGGRGWIGAIGRKVSRELDDASRWCFCGWGLNTSGKMEQKGLEREGMCVSVPKKQTCVFFYAAA